MAKALKGDISQVDIIPGIIVTAILHYAWNTAPSILSISMIFPFTLNSFRMMIKTALEDERNWGYEQFAPDEGD